MDIIIMTGAVWQSAIGCWQCCQLPKILFKKDRLFLHPRDSSIKTNNTNKHPRHPLTPTAYPIHFYVQQSTTVSNQHLRGGLYKVLSSFWYARSQTPLQHLYLIFCTLFLSQLPPPPLSWQLCPPLTQHTRTIRPLPLVNCQSVLVAFTLFLALFSSSAPHYKTEAILRQTWKMTPALQTKNIEPLLCVPLLANNEEKRN